MRYILFGGECYYAAGGAFDLLGTGNSVDDLVASAKHLKASLELDWFHIYDTESKSVVAASVVQSVSGDEPSHIEGCEVYREGWL